jgi:hypothetical protein
MPAAPELETEDQCGNNPEPSGKNNQAGVRSNLVKRGVFAGLMAISGLVNQRLRTQTQGCADKRN